MKSGQYIIPNGTTVIESAAFRDCSHLTSVFIPSTVTMISDHAFQRCNGLTELVIETGVQSIGEKAFSECSSLTVLTLPSTVTAIGHFAFAACSNLTTVSYLGNSDPYLNYEFIDDDDDFDDFGSEIFANCDQLSKICVPMNYGDSDFCDSGSYCMTDDCDNLDLHGDFCFEEVCFYGEKEILPEKTKNAIDWESLSNACVEFECTFGFGPNVTTMCLTTEKMRRMCVNDGCLPVDNWESRVEIEITKTRADYVILANISDELQTNTGVRILDIGNELEDNGYVVRIIVQVSSESDGEAIQAYVNNLDQCESCGSILHRRKSVQVVTTPRHIEVEASDAYRVHDSVFQTVIIMVFMSIITIFHFN